MKIAIPLFQKRISPRFDCAHDLLLITTDNGKHIIERNEIVFGNSNYIERINLLEKTGVDVIICGGVSNDMLDLFEDKKIEVIPWVTGEAEKALELFMRGKLIPGSILSPGRRIQQWGFCSKGEERQKGKRKGKKI